MLYIILIAVLFNLICGAVCASMATAKNRNGVFWFAGGFILSILAIVVLATRPKLRASPWA